MNPESSASEEFHRLWRRATLAMQLWASAAFFLTAASAWQFHRWHRTLQSLSNPPPGVKPNPELIRTIGNPLLIKGGLDAALALLTLAGTAYYFRRRRRLVYGRQAAGSAAS